VTKRDYLGEIREIKERNQWGRASLEMSIRLDSIRDAFDKQPELSLELLRYFPVALVALIEGYFRARIKELLDYDNKYLTNLASDGGFQLKLDLSVARAIEGRAITVGDFVAHLLPINDLSTLAGHMSRLTGADFLTSISGVHNRYDVEVRKQPATPIISDAHATFANVQGTFETRHIICHELASALKLGRSQVEAYVRDCSAFLRAANEYLGNLQFPNAPLTQADMNEAATRGLDAAKQRLSGVVLLIAEELQKRNVSERLAEFNKLQGSWEEYAKASAEYATQPFAGGTISPLVYANKLEEVTLERAEDLEGYLQSLQESSDGSDWY